MLSALWRGIGSRVERPRVDTQVAIEFQDLSFTYPDGKQALHDLSLQAAAGDTIGLVGPNGAGKTTLFLCLAGILAPQKGTIRVAGLDPRNAADRKRLPAHVGIIFQNSDDQLFSSTIADDVAFGPLNLGLPAEEVRRRVAEALGRVGLTGFDERVPFHLSGGEKRRAAIAGVLAMRPEILLLDEPSMFLDPRGRRELIRLLNELTVTKVIASHDLEMILDSCRRVAVLDQGKLVATGAADEVLRDSALMEAHGLEVPFRLRR
ncbi:MAG: energy-coupling factor ABC transporter ATP-binding protein [Planctomycetes bacterium]|nr:energy-coupling factor ABC transporter ATP-binding protein [Planctomycetota bacterium]